MENSNNHRSRVELQAEQEKYYLEANKEATALLMAAFGLAPDLLGVVMTPDDLNFGHPQPFGGGNILC